MPVYPKESWHRPAGQPAKRLINNAPRNAVIAYAGRQAWMMMSKPQASPTVLITRLHLDPPRAAAEVPACCSAGRQAGRRAPAPAVLSPAQLSPPRRRQTRISAYTTLPDQRTGRSCFLSSSFLGPGQAGQDRAGRGSEEEEEDDDDDDGHRPHRRGRSHNATHATATATVTSTRAFRGAEIHPAPRKQQAEGPRSNRGLRDQSHRRQQGKKRINLSRRLLRPPFP
ncbi:hypothetical protein GGR56DRAFT_398420 [Xylariaceae sp. FL0804]|nr:hypothetical protein GGR56DRAFT_398420 [Xylariaceae sp. FL0804]